MNPIIHIQYHVFSNGHLWIIPWTTRNKQKQAQLYRNWARKETMKILESIKCK